VIFVGFYKRAELKGYFRFFKIGDVEKQGVKLFIFLMIAYFYEQSVRRTRRLGDRVARKSLMSRKWQKTRGELNKRS
jgi:hypothetical protein